MSPRAVSKTPARSHLLSLCICGNTSKEAALATEPCRFRVYQTQVSQVICCPNDLDQYLRAEFTKQLRGKILIVLDAKDADAILTGVSEEEKGTGAKITGRYLGLHDV